MNTRTLSAALLALALVAPARAQQLVAWPIGQPNPGWRWILPGMPTRPLPMPHPMPHPLPGPRPGPMPTESPVTLSGYHVEGNVTDGAAELNYRIVFHNPTPNRMEGVLLVPLPANASVSGFKMTVAGKTANAELLESGQASTIYENIVRQLRDPGLLELVGERLLRARVFPIEPNADIEVRLAIAQTLEKSGNLYSLSVPMRSARMSGAAKSGQASAELNLVASRPIRTIYSPNAEAKITRSGDTQAKLRFEGGATDDADLRMFFSLQQSPLAAGLLTFKESGEDGYFLLSLSPKPKAAEGEVQPKDIVFVLDRSGSMDEDQKMTQAKKALSYCIGKLSPGDRFGIVDFASDSSEFESALVNGTDDNKARALRYVKKIESAGGTNIEAGLQDGLKLLSGSREGRTAMLFFLTDGVPTVGQTQIDALLKQAQDGNHGVSARVFSFGVGDDVNTLLLDKLAEMNRGAHDYVGKGEDLENKVSSLYQKVSQPALTDVKVEWQGLETEQVYPRPVTDVFYGGELVLMGRYSKPGSGRLIVTGKAAGKPMRFEYPVTLAADSSKNDFLPRLWANLKVAHELDAVRLSGRADPEVVASIVKLAKKYGIVTPYTSFLIAEEGVRNAHGVAMDNLRAMNMDARGSGFDGNFETFSRARKASRMLQEMRGAGESAGGMAAPAAMTSMMKRAEYDVREDMKAKGVVAVEKKALGGKAFYFRGGSWTDGECDASCDSAKEIRYLSEEYFDLLGREPDLRRYFSLGARVTVLWKGTVYRIVD
ncbi:MAG TPA: VIT domain-containing protein [Elusimicrobiota bacterium]|nr:VIT domain-containing protein [Elusimicrobiota bacterium]